MSTYQKTFSTVSGQTIEERLSFYDIKKLLISSSGKCKIALMDKTNGNISSVWFIDHSSIEIDNNYYDLGNNYMLRITNRETTSFDVYMTMVEW